MADAGAAPALFGMLFWIPIFFNILLEVKQMNMT